MDAYAENQRLRELEQRVTDPERWMKWCDIRALEEVEALQAENQRLREALRKIELAPMPDDGETARWMAEVARAALSEGGGATREGYES